MVFHFAALCTFPNLFLTVPIMDGHRNRSGNKMCTLVSRHAPTTGPRASWWGLVVFRWCMPAPTSKLGSEHVIPIYLSTLSVLHSFIIYIFVCLVYILYVCTCPCNFAKNHVLLTTFCQCAIPVVSIGITLAELLLTTCGIFHRTPLFSWETWARNS